MKPIVSIIIPHFNRSGLLASALDSIQANGLPDCEVIVVDDGSSVEERRAIAKLASESVRILDRHGLKGPARCRNIGISESRADFVIFLDSDDLLAPWSLSQRLTTADRNSSIDFYVFPVLLFSAVPGDRNVLWNEIDNGVDPAERFAKSDPPWHTSGPIWKKSALERIGGFNERVFYGDDSDLHMRALLSGLVPRLASDALPDVFVRRGSDDRITNSLSAGLIASRLERLREGSAFLSGQSDFTRVKDWFAGQYFSEAEFILFNAREFSGSIDAVLRAWIEDWKPSRRETLLVEGYFRLALATRNNAYFVLRVARRVAKTLLPGEFFPTGGSFECGRLDAARMDDVRFRLQESRQTRKSALPPGGDPLIVG